MSYWRGPVQLDEFGRLKVDGSEVIQPVSGDLTVTLDEITSNNRPLYIGSKTAIADNALTTVVTVPSNGIKYITKIHCSGMLNAKWQLFLNSVLMDTLRTDDRNVSFDWNLPLKILGGEVLDVKVTHFNTVETSDFDATIYGYSPL